MCGVVGIIGKPSMKMYKVFRDMLQFDVVRGPHSTGVAAISEGRTYVQKGIILPTDLLNSPKFNKNVDNNYHKMFCLMGHNRWATEGAVIRKNAHPFQHGHIVLMHNGTLHKRMPEDGKKFGTDSEGIAYNVAKDGIDAAYKKLDGAATLVFYDQKAKTLNLISNGKRPLVIFESSDSEQVLWASEPWMVEAACNRNGFKLKEARVFPKDHHLFTFQYMPEDKVTLGETRRLEPYTPFVQSQYLGQRTSNPNGRNAVLYEDNEIWGGFYRRNHMAAPPTGVTETVYSPELQMWVAPHIANQARARKVAAQAEKDAAEVRRRIQAENLERVKQKQQADGSGGGRSVVPFGQQTADFISELQAKQIPEHEFNRIYDTCLLCDGSLEGEYKTSIIVDHRHAICGNCITDNEGIGMSPEETLHLAQQTVKGA